METVNKFRELVKKSKAYIYVLQLCGWDSNTEAPRGAFPRRAELLGIIGSELFKLQTSKETQDIIYGLYAKKDELDPFTKREIEKAKKELDKIIKIPESEFIEYQQLIQLSQVVWQDAKANSDFNSFKDNLQKIFDFNKKFISYYGIDDHPYNVLLDDYEEGMSMKEYNKFFDVLKKDLVPFVKEILATKKNSNDAFMNEFFDASKQQEFCDYLIDVLAFDRNRGLMKKSVHPFTWNTSPDDVRFTTRYLENYVFSSIFAVIHELGHATYEQQIDTKWDNTLLNSGTSMGIHESQSRFFENIIGRSKSFWEVHYPKFKSLFPEQLRNVSLDDFYRATNKVEASLIRVEADELTYSLHIMIRYEIERMILSDEVQIEDLPKVWNKLMIEYLGIEPKNDGEGVLQDVHWSSGLIGYFPTYALGTAYSAQFYYSMKKELDIDKLVSENKISEINLWLKEKIHQFGASKSPKELLLEVTKEEFNPKYYVQYLKEKYTEIYLK
ncbi:MAG: carboxypeptidase M32 [Firmicutes bacterium]|nr:carboxypeptidase M32 [Bacillota bacterium]